MNSKSTRYRLIYCCECGKEVKARLTTGLETYPHAPHTFNLPFWKCDHCNNFVGCHHKGGDKTKPLGCIPTFKIKQFRKKIHSVLDPLWKKKLAKRKDIYDFLTANLGHDYHTGEIRSVSEAKKVLHLLDKFKNQLKESREKTGFESHKGIL